MLTTVLRAFTLVEFVGINESPLPLFNADKSKTISNPTSDVYHCGTNIPDCGTSSGFKPCHC